MQYTERTSDAAGRWKVTTQTIRNWMRAFGLPHEKLVGGYRLIQPESDEIIKKHIGDVDGATIYATH